MTMCIMVQGTMSGVGKSMLVTALCRAFLQDGLRVAPFKSQNMALNSFVTPDGLELGRAQAVQAEAAGKLCDVRMNPVLLKPSSDTGSQVIVNGKVYGNYTAAAYFQQKKQLLPEILRAYNSLAEENDVIVIEGAGSPVEINLRENDIVNMGLARHLDAPVLLAGDIDRGGIFAQLYGTMALLRPDEKNRVTGTIINKFRGDIALLQPGLQELEKLTGVPVLGVMPWLPVILDDEDSLTEHLRQRRSRRALDIAVLRLPHISNFTDFPPLEEHPDIGVRYVARSDQMAQPDLIILPGTKSTLGDLRWLRENGLDETILQLAAAGTPVLGICGGYQMLGETLLDPEGIERQGETRGLGLLPASTVFTAEKTLCRREATVLAEPFRGADLTGYEIHMGQTQTRNLPPFCRFTDGTTDGAVQGAVFGTYLHGLFDSASLTVRLAEYLAAKRGITVHRAAIQPRTVFRQQQYDLLADALRTHLDLKRIYKIMEAYAHDRPSSASGY